jgi:hypothetical protein
MRSSLIVSFFMLNYCKNVYSVSVLGNQDGNHIVSMLKTTIEASYVTSLREQPACFFINNAFIDRYFRERLRKKLIFLRTGQDAE